MKRKSVVEKRREEMSAVLKNLSLYDLGYRKGYRDALTWILSKSES